jgi:hypothetical protein
LANGSGGFNSHLANSRESETPAAAQRSDLDEFIDNLDETLLPNLAKEIEEESTVDATLTRAAPGLLESDSIRSEEEHTRILFGLHKTASIYQELTQSEFLSALEEDCDNLLKFRDAGATACREAPVFNKYSDSDDDSKTFPGCHLGLAITSTPQDRFVYWMGMEPSELLEYDSRVVAFIQELPFQEGKLLSPIIEEGEGRIVLIDYSSSGEFSLQHLIYLASLHEHDDDDEPGRKYDDKLLADVSADECTVDAPQDEDEEHRRIRRIKNAKCAKRRQNIEARARNPP